MDAGSPELALATYGTLAPGRPNHHQLDGLSGEWSQGRVFGTLVERTLANRGVLDQADRTLLSRLRADIDHYRKAGLCLTARDQNE